MIRLEFDKKLKRLMEEFAQPFRSWAHKHHAVVVDYFTGDLIADTDVMKLVLRSSYERQRFTVIDDPIATFFFGKHGGCDMEINGKIRSMSTWDRGARAALAFAHEMGRRDVERARQLNKGLQQLRRVLNAPKKPRSRTKKR